MHDPASVPADLTHADVRMVGNYALTMRFSDGHDTGIFPFRFLREHDPARVEHGPRRRRPPRAAGS